MEQLFSLALSLAALCNFVATNKPPCPHGAAARQTTTARSHSVPPGRDDNLRWLVPVVVLARDWHRGQRQVLFLQQGRLVQ